MRSGLKENCPLKPQLEVLFTEGNIFLLPSSPKDFHCNFPKFSLISPTILNSWIVHFLAGLIFTENILVWPGSIWELMEVGDQAFSLTFLSPSYSQVFSQHFQHFCAITASHELWDRLSPMYWEVLGIPSVVCMVKTLWGSGGQLQRRAGVCTAVQHGEEWTIPGESLARCLLGRASIEPH